MFPKIQFEPMTLEWNVNLIKWAYFANSESLDIHNYTIHYFPELIHIDENSSKKDIDSLIEQTVSKYYKNNCKQIISEVERYNKIWEYYNDKYFEALSNYLHVSIPNNLKIIKAYVGLIPVFPRYLDSYSFAVSTNLEENKIIEVCAHETCHFLWFLKWKELYPNCSRKEYDSPYNPWKYSEMVVDPILNSEEIHSILHIKENAYDSFYELKDKNNENMMQTLQDIYKIGNIEEKIKNGYEYVCSVLDKEKLNKNKKQ